MIEYNVSLKYDDFDHNKAFNIAIDRALTKIALIIEKEAKYNHKYRSRTGNLTRATQVRRIKDSIQAFINDTQAKYGKYVHDGTSKWSPDPFIDNAIKNNRTLIEKIIVEELDKAYA
jgi:HK97 gp10 family phage protein